MVEPPRVAEAPVRTNETTPSSSTGIGDPEYSPKASLYPGDTAAPSTPCVVDWGWTRRPPSCADIALWERTVLHTPAMTYRACTAFIDESFRRGPDGHGFYFLAAAIVPDEHVAELTGRLRAHLPPGMRRWHWRDEGTRSRRQFTSLISEFAGLGVEAVVCCQMTSSQRKGEQAGVALAGLVYRHGRPLEEPMLWVADAIVGAVGMEVASSQGQLAELLPETMSTVRWVAAP